MNPDRKGASNTSASHPHSAATEEAAGAPARARIEDGGVRKPGRFDLSGSPRTQAVERHRIFEPLQACAALLDRLPALLRDPEQGPALRQVCAALEQTSQRIVDAGLGDDEEWRRAAPAMYRGLLAASRVLTHLHEKTLRSSRW
ncbi:hypothetical protein [Caldimonas brevitalea]|uniref:Uncharacterized protein n=1 Tax=Caldimonas brevitalea TaxID=413882 RepID=A0A0G3BUP5_9BURK|nr:hypothetical protein [Caldimonas brevitalea]AKJ31738.1 hypothetical protein AAW51_5047 [Caldimonas brevitalea]